MSTSNPTLVRPALSNANSTDFMSRERSIGAILVDAGRMTVEEAEIVLQEQRVKGMRFGEAAIRLGLLKQADIDFAISRQFNYPYLQLSDNSLSHNLIAAFKPFDKTVEQLRALRSQLILRWFDGDVSHKAIAVVSPDKKEGKSFVAANLAVVFSQLGERTLLIDADLREPHQQDFFKLHNRIGLSNILSGRAGSEAIVRIPGLLDLSVLPAGTIPPNPLELIGQPLFAKLLEEASMVFDSIIIDTPAASVESDAVMISARAGAAILVARKDVTPLKSIENTSSIIKTAGVNLIGAVLNEF